MKSIVVLVLVFGCAAPASGPGGGVACHYTASDGSAPIDLTLAF